MTFSRFYFKDITTISNADPAVVTLTDHELQVGDRIRLETTGALPSPLAVKTDYYVVYNGLGTGVFQVASADGGEPIATTDAGSGTHSFIQMNRAGLTPRQQDNH